MKANLLVYPNPFKDEAIIQFYLVNESKVSLELYNLTGQKIRAVLDDAYLEKGIQHFSLNRNNLPNGAYICMLRTNNSVETQKIIIQ